jgi:hypothetical protein
MELYVPVHGRVLCHGCLDGESANRSLDGNHVYHDDLTKAVKWEYGQCSDTEGICAVPSRAL